MKRLRDRRTRRLAALIVVGLIAGMTGGTYAAFSATTSNSGNSFGVKADFFAYPAGRYDDRVEAATKAAGYKAAVTVDEGIARGRDDPFALKRVRVNASDTAVTLLAKLRG